MRTKKELLANKYLFTNQYVFNPDQSIGKVTTTDILGHTTETVLGPYSLPVTVTQFGVTGGQPYDKRTAWSYGSAPEFNLASVSAASRAVGGAIWATVPGSATTFTYGDTARVDLPASSTQLNYRTWQYAYAETGSPRLITSPQNMVPFVGSDDANSSIQSVTYYADGLPWKITDALNRVVEMTYAAKSYPSGSPYYGKQNHLEVTMERKWDGGKRSMSFDSEGKVTESVNENQVRTVYVYNLAGQLTELREVANGANAARITSYAYDDRGDLVAMTPPKGTPCQVRYSYDRVDEYGNPSGPYEGRLTRIDHPDGTAEFFGYNEAGELQWESRPFIANNVPQVATIRYYRDDLHRVTQIVYPGDPGTVDTAYDEFGRVTSVTKEGETTGYTYDALDRVTRIDVGPNRRDLTIGYEADGNNGRWIVHKTLQGVAGEWTEYEDTKGRLRGIDSPVNRLAGSGQTFGQGFGFEYDRLGRLVNRYYRETATSAVKRDASYAYNDPLRQSVITYYKSDQSTVLERFVNQYDKVGRLTSETDNANRVHGYQYNSLNQLEVETHPDFAGTGIAYTYDANGNRESVTQGNAVDWYRVDNADKLQWINRGTNATTDPALGSGNQPYTSYRYDAFGQLIWRQRRATSGGAKKTFDFSWDTDGRLVGARKGANDVFIANYSADGDRIAKTDSESGSHAYSFGLHDSNGTGWLFTPGFGHQDGTKIRKYHTDQLGSTRTLTNQTGDTATTTYRYDAYGQVTNMGGSSSDTYPTESQFAGAYGYQAEPTTGDGLDLQYLYQRYYDPQAGRFISRDPIRWAGGANLYGYAENNPANLVDPRGESADAAARAATTALGFAAADGPLPIGDLVAVGLLFYAGYELSKGPIYWPQPASTPAPITSTLSAEEDRLMIHILGGRGLKPCDWDFEKNRRRLHIEMGKKKKEIRTSEERNPDLSKKVIQELAEKLFPEVRVERPEDPRRGSRGDGGKNGSGKRR